MTEYKRLKNIFKLSHKVSLYLPSLTPDGKDIPGRDKIVNDGRKLLSKLFGGCTTTKAIGSWILKTGKLQNERITLLYSFAKELTPESIDQILDYCLEVKKIGNQENISLELDGELHFI